MTPGEVADWMRSKLVAESTLYQHEVVDFLNSRENSVHIKVSSNGTLSISAPVLRAFRGLTRDDAVWVRDEKAWRFRSATDTEGSRVAG